MKDKREASVHAFQHMGDVYVSSVTLSVGTRRNVSGQLNSLTTLLPGKDSPVFAKQGGSTAGTDLVKTRFPRF